MDIRYDPTRPRFPDVNHWHPVISGSQVAATHPPALGFKVIESGSQDPTWRDHDALAKGMAIPRLGYMFDTDGVDSFLAAFTPEKGRIPVIDFEGSPSVSQAEQDATRLHAEHGIWPFFYGRSLWIAAGQPTGTVMENCPFWGAEYGDVLRVPTGLGPTVAHQFYGGIVGPEPHTWPGVSGNCDINSLIWTVDRLRQYAGLNVPKPAPKFPGRLLSLKEPRMHGEDVLEYKHQLIKLKYNVSTTDVYGGRTDQATRQFQQTHKLAVDGVVGQKTWDAVFAAR